MGPWESVPAQSRRAGPAGRWGGSCRRRAPAVLAGEDRRERASDAPGDGKDRRVRLAASLVELDPDVVAVDRVAELHEHLVLVEPDRRLPVA